MKVRWTPEAEQDRTAIWDYRAARDPDAAVRLDRLFSDAVAGKYLINGKEAATRSWTFKHK